MRAPECSQDSAGIGLTLSFQEACADSNSPEHWNSNLGKPQTRRTIGITRLCYPKDTSVTILAVFAARAHLWRGAASHAAGGAKGRVTCHKCRRDLPAKTGIVSWQAPLPSAALRSQAVISAASRFVLSRTRRWSLCRESVYDPLHSWSPPVNIRVHRSGQHAVNYLNSGRLGLELFGWTIALTGVFPESREKGV